MTKTVTVPSQFTLKDGSGTTYLFSTLAWQTGECSATGHYLLTKITDRWEQELNITWGNVITGGTAMRVTTVSNPGGPTLTLEYPQNDGLLRSVRLSTEPVGVTHSIGYGAVADETGVNRQKLTSITVRGPAGAATRARTWNFAYRIDAGTDNDAYSGTVTGDLVIRKTQPNNVAYSYVYAPVTLSREMSHDFDGEILSISWPDPEATRGKRTIARAVTGPNQVTITHPGGVQTQYNYSGSDLVSMTELANTPAARTWTYAYDSQGRHNLAKVWSPLEPTSGDPLIEYEYTFSNGRITGVTTWVPLENSTATTRSRVETLFNTLNLPTQITAYHDPAATFPTTLGHPAYEDQITTFQYDTLTKGNLTLISRRESATQSWHTTFYYNPATVAGQNGLPEWVKNDVEAQTLFQYDPISGLPTRVQSPENTAVGSGPDFPASVTQMAYEEHGLPTQMVDALGRSVTTSYQAGGDPRHLNVITAFGADGSFRIKQLDAMDRPNIAQDEEGDWTRWTYTPGGALKSITRNADDPVVANRRTTAYYYDDRGDLVAIDPPRGSSGRIQFFYNRWVRNPNDSLTETTTYQGRPTRIVFADGRSEIMGYNQAGELIWKRKSAGTFISLERDKQHRVKSVSYPLGAGGAAFTVTTAWDEFGRVRRTTDQNGTSFTVYDNLNRPKQQILPAPQKSMDFSYQPDLGRKRWTTAISVPGLGSYLYREDTKGRLYEVQNPALQEFRLEYTLTGMLRQRTWDNNVREEREYNGRDWLKRLLIWKPNGSDPNNPAHLHNRYDYSYLINPNDPTSLDGTGHLRREVDLGGQTHEFLYNDLYELVGEADSALGPGTVSYSYDLNGNRSSRSQNGVVDYYGVDAADKLLWVNRGLNAPPDPVNRPEPYTLFGYNANGVQSYRERRLVSGRVPQSLWFWWDGADKLRKVSDINDQTDPTPFFTAGYDGDGIRVKKSDWRGGPGLVAHDYSYGPQGLIWESNPPTTYTPGFGHRSASTDRFYHTDWLGSTRYVTDTTGQGSVWTNAVSYDAWGNRPLASPAGTHPTDLLFAGAWGYQTEWSSATEPGLGLQYLQQRYYDPAIGRFISPDPIGIAGGLNLYGYGSGDPVGIVDPTGLLTLPSDPTGLGAGWRHERGHEGSERYIRKDGRMALEYDPARPGKGGHQEKPHWHRLIPHRYKKGHWVRSKNKADNHLYPGTEVKDCGEATLDLRKLLDQTVLDRRVVLPESLLAPQVTSYPAAPPLPWYKRAWNGFAEIYLDPENWAGALPGLPIQGIQLPRIRIPGIGGFPATGTFRPPVFAH